MSMMFPPSGGYGGSFSGSSYGTSKDIRQLGQVLRQADTNGDGSASAAELYQFTRMQTQFGQVGPNSLSDHAGFLLENFQAFANQSGNGTAISLGDLNSVAALDNQTFQVSQLDLAFARTPGVSASILSLANDPNEGRLLADGSLRDNWGQGRDIGLGIIGSPPEYLRDSGWPPFPPPHFPPPFRPNFPPPRPYLPPFLQDDDGSIPTLKTDVYRQVFKRAQTDDNAEQLSKAELETFIDKTEEKLDKLLLGRSGRPSPKLHEYLQQLKAAEAMLANYDDLADRYVGGANPSPEVLAKYGQITRDGITRLAAFDGQKRSISQEDFDLYIEDRHDPNKAGLN